MNGFLLIHSEAGYPIRMVKRLKNEMAAKAFIDTVHFKEETVIMCSSGPRRRTTLSAELPVEGVPK